MLKHCASICLLRRQYLKFEVIGNSHKHNDWPLVAVKRKITITETYREKKSAITISK